MDGLLVIPMKKSTDFRSITIYRNPMSIGLPFGRPFFFGGWWTERTQRYFAERTELCQKRHNSVNKILRIKSYEGPKKMAVLDKRRSFFVFIL